MTNKLIPDNYTFGQKGCWICDGNGNKIISTIGIPEKYRNKVIQLINLAYATGQKSVSGQNNLEDKVFLAIEHIDHESQLCIDKLRTIPLVDIFHDKAENVLKDVYVKIRGIHLTIEKIKKGDLM